MEKRCESVAFSFEKIPSYYIDYFGSGKIRLDFKFSIQSMIFDSNKRFCHQLVF